MNHDDIPSTRPYLVRALHEWCTDHGYTPYIAVAVDATVQVPKEFVKNGEIVLNVSHEATSHLTLGNEWIEFKARFGGVSRELVIPVDHVIAIYARENGQGMAFPAPVLAASPAPAPATPLEVVASAPRDAGVSDEQPPSPPAGGSGKPVLKRVK